MTSLSPAVNIYDFAFARPEMESGMDSHQPKRKHKEVNSKHMQQNALLFGHVNYSSIRRFVFGGTIYEQM